MKDLCSYSSTPKRCYFSSSYSTQSSAELVTEQSISPLAQKRVLELLSHFKHQPQFKKGKQNSLNSIASWVDGGAGDIDPETFNFLLHVCVTCGSGDDMDLALAIAQRQDLELKESEMNPVLTSLSQNAELRKVKEMLNRVCKDGLKLRVNTLTSLLRRGVNEMDFPFTIEVLDILRTKNFFPSSTNVINDAIRACVGVKTSEAVKVVQGVMALHNSYSMDVPQREVNQETVTEFSHWILRYNCCTSVRVCSIFFLNLQFIERVYFKTNENQR